MKTNNNLAPIITVQPNHIRMISERLCDTEDWSNDAEIQLLQKYITFLNIFKQKSYFTT